MRVIHAVLLPQEVKLAEMPGAEKPGAEKPGVPMQDYSQGQKSPRGAAPHLFVGAADATSADGAGGHQI